MRSMKYTLDHPFGVSLMTKLDKPMRRELQVGDAVFTLVIAPEGLKLAQKGRRQGIELRWTDLVSGDAALAVALQASVGQ